jgi:hypothetical protein
LHTPYSAIFISTSSRGNDRTPYFAAAKTNFSIF